jgi:hypothetical protein
MNKLLLRLVPAAVALVATNVQADTWEANTQLSSSSESWCGNVPLDYQFSVDGAGFRGISPTGKVLDAIVGPDGDISVEYEGDPRLLGTVRIVGNARTRELFLTASAKPGCQYSLLPSGAGGPSSRKTASLKPGADWAFGRWEGHIFKSGAAGGARGISSSRRALIIRKRADGVITCNWAEPEHARNTPAFNCKIDGESISLVTSANSLVELRRSGANAIAGTFRDVNEPQPSIQVAMNRTQ